MTDRTMTRILIGMAIVAAATLCFLTGYMNYVDSRQGYDVCENYVRSCE